MTPERAQEIIEKQSHFPNWGNFQKFMSDEEKIDIQNKFLNASESKGYLSFSSIIYRIAQNKDPLTGVSLKS